MLDVTQKEWLVPEKDQVLTPKRYSAGHVLCKDYQGVVLHYTAGNFKSSLNALTANDKGGSAHFLLGRDGQLKQLAPLSARTWHAEAKNNGSKFMGNPRVNSITVGIEIENFGWLTKQEDGTGWKAWMGTAVPDDEVLEAKLSVVKSFEKRPGPASVYAWHKYTETQLVALDKLLVDLAAAGVPMNLSGHEFTDPLRKFDPGPAFPWERFLKPPRIDVRTLRS